MMVAIAVMIGSFRDTVVYWVGQTLQADLFIGPGIRPTVGSEQTVSPEVIAAVGTHPDVVAVDPFRNVDLVYDGNLVVLGAGTFDVVLDARRAAVQEPRPTRAMQLRRAIGTDAVIVSEAFANALSARRDGDTLTLPTPQGAATVRDRGGLLRLRERSRRGRHGPRHASRKYFGDLPPTRRRGLPAAGRRSRDRCAREMLDDARRRPSRVHLHQPRRCATRSCASSTARLRSPTRSRSSPSSWRCSAWPARCSRWCSSGAASCRCCG